jgi:hypothetical protein
MQLNALFGFKNEALVAHNSKGKHRTLYIKKKYCAQYGEYALMPPMKEKKFLCLQCLVSIPPSQGRSQVNPNVESK